MSGNQSKMTRHAQKQENSPTTCRKLIEIDPEQTQLIKLSDKDVNTDMVTALLMFKK